MTVQKWLHINYLKKVKQLGFWGEIWAGHDSSQVSWDSPNQVRCDAYLTWNIHSQSEHRWSHVGGATQHDTPEIKRNISWCVACVQNKAQWPWRRCDACWSVAPDSDTDGTKHTLLSSRTDAFLQLPALNKIMTKRRISSKAYVHHGIKHKNGNCKFYITILTCFQFWEKVRIVK